jgi:MEDS: MEthanogen/methylotroph, DcmR Sensory domain
MYQGVIAGQIALRVQLRRAGFSGETVVSGVEHLDVGHAVQFYTRDDELADYVADYLLGALETDRGAVVIAAAAHRRAFETRLTQAGADLAAARRNSTYLALDASETLHSLMPGGELDADRFERVIGGVIRRAGQGGSTARPVRTYGEMVALLWNDGLVEQAVKLEEMWEALASRQSFSLLCSYPAGQVAGDGYLPAFAEVCRLHRAVVIPRPAAEAGPPAEVGPAAEAGPGAARAFAFSRDAPAAARHFAVDTVRRLGAGDLAEDVALVVTELAANAIVHAHSGFTVDLRPGRDMLRISVRDAAPVPAGQAESGLPAAPLHGLGAVNALARRWGVEALGGMGKSVWVELAQ